MRSPAFTAIVVLTLALGIGANTAIFALIDQLMLRTLPVARPEELVILDSPGPTWGSARNDGTFSYPMYRALREEGRILSSALARFPAFVSLTFGEKTERVPVELVSGNYFQVLGVGAALGRTLSPEDETSNVPDTAAIAVLSHAAWRRHFGGDRGVLFRTVLVNAHPFTIVGVADEGFFGLEVGASPDLFVPIAMKGRVTPTWNDLDNPRSLWLHIVARLGPSLARRRAELALGILYRQLLTRELPTMPDASEAFRARYVEKPLRLLPGARGLSDARAQFAMPLFALLGIVGLVLLISCASVANLLIARAGARQKEIVLRLAVGASRRRLLGQLLVESLVLAFLGGAAGVGVASVAGRALLSRLPDEVLARALSAAPSPRVVGFAALVSALTALVFGLAPALQATRLSLSSALKDESASVVSGSQGTALRKGLVIAQVALSLVLLVLAGLFWQSLVNLRRLDPGFTPTPLVAFTIDAPLNGYSQDAARVLYGRLLDELRSVPGVVDASLAEIGAMTRTFNRKRVRVEGYQPRATEDMNPHVNAIGPGFFATLGVPLLAGRELTPQDGAASPRVAVINDSMARHYFGTTSPLRHRLGYGRDEVPSVEIVGVVPDVKWSAIHEEAPRMFFVPYAQLERLEEVTFYVRATQAPATIGREIRKRIAQIDPRLPVFHLKTVGSQIDESLFADRMIAGLSAAVGLFATLLAALGLYGVMTYNIVRRTREIGVRMALGAGRGAVLALVLSDAARLIAIGIAIGLPASLAIASLLQFQLFGLTAKDPLTLAIATATIAATGLLAGLIPADRAARLDPMRALKRD